MVIAIGMQAPGKHGVISRVRLEGKNTPIVCLDGARRQQRVVANIGADIDNRHARLQQRLKNVRFIAFVSSQANQRFQGAFESCVVKHLATMNREFAHRIGFEPGIQPLV
jgi:hypothetical protein